MDYPVQLSTQLQQLLKSLRKSRRMTQAALAQRLGVVQSRIADIERDPSAISVEQLLKILAMLDAQMVIREIQAETFGTPPSGEPETSTFGSTSPAQSQKSPPKGTPDNEPQGRW
jgi:HTH-type transcriptional regulator / antitoxin HipB